MSKNTFIQIDNVGFLNKGAELMLYAIMQRLEGDPGINAKFVAGKIYGNEMQIRKSGLYQIPYLQRYKIKFHEKFTTGQLSRLGLVNKRDVSVLLDAGGFQFGDQWEKYNQNNLNVNLKEYYAYYKKRQCKIIFLPQAFGPFTKPLSTERIEIVYDAADILYAREKTSYNYLIELFGKSDKIRLAPDFTSLAECDLPLKLYHRVKDAVCIIPNARMTDMTNKEISDAYTKFLYEVATYVLNRREKLVLLNHEGPGDWVLIQDLLKKFDDRDEIIEAIDGLDALEIKAVIGHCKLLISSRFHGVVSGFNQGIPTLCTSWSHKYEELLNDYRLPGNIININKPDSTIDIINSVLKTPDKFRPEVKTISKLKINSEQMWKDILAVIA
ncbi:MAG: polysaccharide pyruvyl transferase family protein [Cyclobacteriaceae bacterium]|nr:polysaccharide pyruvyl transferase family protein [Cyclobacteriaceae bacterium]